MDCCMVCERSDQTLRNGRCPACTMYLRRHGKDRPARLIDRWWDRQWEKASA